MFWFKKKIKKKPLCQRVQEVMSIRDIHGNLPVMPIMHEDGTVEAIYGPITCTCISEREYPIQESIKLEAI